MPFNLGPIAPGAISNLVATVASLAVQFTWDPQAPSERVQIWKSSTNDVTTATMIVGNLADHNFADPFNAGSSTVYYFLRLVNYQGATSAATANPGPWSYETLTIDGITASVTDGSITPAKLSSGFAIDPSTGNLKSDSVGAAQIIVGVIDPTHLDASFAAVDNVTGALKPAVVGSGNMVPNVIPLNGGGMAFQQQGPTTSGAFSYDSSMLWATLSGYSGTVTFSLGGGVGSTISGTGVFTGAYNTAPEVFSFGTFTVTGPSIGLNFEFGADLWWSNTVLTPSTGTVIFSVIFGLYNNTTSSVVWQQSYSVMQAFASGTGIAFKVGQPYLHKKLFYKFRDFTAGVNQLVTVSGNTYTPMIFLQKSQTDSGSTFDASVYNIWGSTTFVPL